MNKLENAINYFQKENEKGVNGSLEKVFAYEIAFKSLSDVNQIFNAFKEYNENHFEHEKHDGKEVLLDKIYHILISK